MSVYLSPSAKQQYFDANGAPLAGGYLYTYASGTTTPLQTYTDWTGGVAHTNPIQLDSRGEAEIYWLNSNYTVVLKDANGNLIYTQDGVSPTSGNGNLVYIGTWNAATNSPTIASGIGETGNYYVVSTAGTTAIDLVNEWAVGDWIVFGNTSWQKVPMGIAYASGTPAGAMMMWPKNVPPAGWLTRDGSAVSRTTYSTLFTVIGTDYGSGDGSTTFNLPDDRGLIQAGYKASDSAFGTFGATVGSKDAINVSHTHMATSSVTDPGHTHSYVTNSNIWHPSNSNGATTMIDPYTTSTGVSTTGISVSTSVASAGASGTDKNIQPSRVYLPIIKY